jgi:hypothetical protein
MSELSLVKKGSGALKIIGESGTFQQYSNINLTLSAGKKYIVAAWMENNYSSSFVLIDNLRIVQEKDGPLSFTLSGTTLTVNKGFNQDLYAVIVLEMA